MTAPALNLVALQAERDAEVRRGRAGRAHRARARLAGDDAEAGHAVERWALRRLRGDARRVVGRAVPDSVKADVVGLCETAFADRLRALGTEVAL